MKKNNLFLVFFREKNTESILPQGLTLKLFFSSNIDDIFFKTNQIYWESSLDFINNKK